MKSKQKKAIRRLGVEALTLASGEVAGAPAAGISDEEHPEVDVWLSTRHSERPGLERGDLDAVITLGDGNYPGYKSWELMRDYVIPVARPRFLGRSRDAGKSRKTLCKHATVCLRHSGILSPGLGLSGLIMRALTRSLYQPALRDGTRFPDTNMAIQAAFEGQGVALGEKCARLGRPGDRDAWCGCSMSTARRMYRCTLLCRPERAESDQRLVAYAGTG